MGPNNRLLFGAEQALTVLLIIKYLIFKAISNFTIIDIIKT